MEELEKFDILLDEYSSEFVDFLKAISIKKGISFEEIYLKLPSSDLVKKDEKLIYSYPVGYVLMGIEDPWSYLLTYHSIMGSIPKDFPLELEYCISLSEGEIKAPFTKQEFLDSVKKEMVGKVKIKRRGE